MHAFSNMDAFVKQMNVSVKEVMYETNEQYLNIVNISDHSEREQTQQKRNYCYRLYIFSKSENVL